MAFNLSFLFHRGEAFAEAMEELLGWLAEGRLRTPPIERLPLERCADAHRALESGGTVGKLVLIP